MRALFRNIWLLTLGVFCFIPWVWLRTKRERMMQTFEIEQALAYVGITLTVLCTLAWLVFTVRGKGFTGWAFPPAYRESVGPDAAPGAGARQLLRIAVTVSALIGVAALPVNVLLLKWDETLAPPTFKARRMAIHESRSLRLDIPEVIESVPAGAKPVALAVVAGESDVQDLAESEIVAYELFPRRVERLWIEDCEAGLSAEQAAQLGAVIYQCNRGDAYRWRDPAAPMPDYWADFEHARERGAPEPDLQRKQGRGAP